MLLADGVHRGGLKMLWSRAVLYSTKILLHVTLMHSALSPAQPGVLLNDRPTIGLEFFMMHSYILLRKFSFLSIMGHSNPICRQILESSLQHLYRLALGRGQGLAVQPGGSQETALGLDRVVPLPQPAQHFRNSLLMLVKVKFKHFSLKGLFFQLFMFLRE